MHELFCCLGYRLRLHFDGYPDTFDFWEPVDSPNIFPAGFAHAHRQRLRPPPGMEGAFDWEAYLRDRMARAAPRECFPLKTKVGRPSVNDDAMVLIQLSTFSI